jgi:hypothetical protein
MKTKTVLVRVWAALTLAAAPSFDATVNACSGDYENHLLVLARQAVSVDKSVASAAIASLRAAGPEGLKALLDTHASLIATKAQRHPLLVLTPDSADNSEWERLRAALDSVGQQRDCHASQLYWFTDLDQAKAAAKAQGKPILSLRLLGKLDEEFSCANSRFFRTTLYANRNVGEFLRDSFILHWKSVRPVPRLTIDFGDGRKIERTITGNSIHYVLDAEGRPIDALPGLYGPRAFLSGLGLAKDAADRYALQSPESREKFLRQYHRDRLAAIATQWSNDLARIGRPFANSSVTQAEIPREMGVQMDDAAWGKIAVLHAEENRLDASSVVLIAAKNPPSAAEASRRARAKSFVEDPLIRTIKNLERSISEDTVRNEYLLHSKIHEWFATGAAPDDTEKLNAKVYADLFLTPDSDPWLGLVPPDTFTALENNGLAQISEKTFNTTTQTKTGL